MRCNNIQNGSFHYSDRTNQLNSNHHKWHLHGFLDSNTSININSLQSNLKLQNFRFFIRECVDEDYYDNFINYINNNHECKFNYIGDNY